MGAWLKEESTITAKGQTTVPKSVRQALGVDYGGRIAFVVDDQRRVYVQKVDADAAEDPVIESFLAFLAAVSFLVITAWGFRFMFLYIPAAAGITGDIIIRTKQGMLMSLQMMGIWLVSTAPFLLVLGMVGSALLSGTPTEGGAPVSLGAAWTLVQTVVSTLMAMVCTAAIAAALRNMIEKPRPSR